MTGIPIHDSTVEILKLYGMTPQGAINLYAQKIVEPERAFTEWFSEIVAAIKSNNEEMAEGLFREFALLNFIGGASTMPFAVQPDEVLECAINKNLIPVMKN